MVIQIHVLVPSVLQILRRRLLIFFSFNIFPRNLCLDMSTVGSKYEQKLLKEPLLEYFWPN